MRYKIILSYNGSTFNGWQIQPNAPSVQETLGHCISVLTGETVQITGAGRTDTGVNAIGYTAHFDLSRRTDTAHLTYKLNAMLPVSIRVHDICETTSEFHARFDATERKYTYFINRIKDPFVREFSYLYTFPLDVDLMNKAAAMMLGTHDFSCFEKVGADNKTSICTVKEAMWAPYTPVHVSEMGYPAREGDYMKFTISADRFLRNMVRATVGSLIEVGRGKRTIENFEALLHGGSRSLAGESVPGHALFLSEVKY